jgi:hypothetical protein
LFPDLLKNIDSERKNMILMIITLALEEEWETAKRTVGVMRLN